MKYDVQIRKGGSGRQAGGDGHGVSTPRHASPIAVARRFAPVVQVLTTDGKSLEQQLSQMAHRSFAEGKALKDICSDLYSFARTSGFDATIGVQEVYSTSMPSFAGQTVISALLMVDLRPLWTSGEAVFPAYRHVG